MLRKLLVMPVLYGLLVLFVACAQPGTRQLPTEAPATPTELRPEVTVTAPPTATATATVWPTTTATAAPTALLATPTAPPATATPTELRPAPTATPTATAAAPTGTPVLELLDMQTTSTTSPSGPWVAVSEVGFPVTKDGPGCAGCSDQYWARLTVRRTDGSQEWVPVSEWRPMGLGYGVPAAFQWSADGAALYFTEISQADGCSFIFSNGSSLRRLDLASGAVADLLPANGYWLTLSPDETQLAYLAYGQRGLVVRDLATGAERAYALGDLGAVQGGMLVWAPDASAVALTVIRDACGGASTWTVLAVTLADGERRVLVPPSDQHWAPASWPEPERLLLIKDNTGWALDLNTGEMTPAD